MEVVQATLISGNYALELVAELVLVVKVELTEVQQFLREPVDLHLRSVLGDILHEVLYLSDYAVPLR